MDKGKVLFIGVGQAGNNAINEVLKLDNRYTGLFVNTAISDIEPLIKSDSNPRNQAIVDENVFILPNTGGSGKDRSKAKDFAKKHSTSIADLLRKYPTQKHIYIVFSMGGGTGSGLAPTLSSIIKMTYGDKKTVHLVAFKQKSKENSRVIKNGIACWNDIVKIYTNERISFDTISFIDNNQFEDELDINKVWADKLNTALGITTSHQKGTIDLADATSLMTTKGYQTIYTLNDIYSENIEEGLLDAKNKSVFYKADNNSCYQLGLSLKPNVYDAYALEDRFSVVDATFKGYNENKNVVVVSGSALPKQMILEMQQDLKNRELEEIEKQRFNQVDASDLIVDIVDEKYDKPKKVIQQKQGLNNGMKTIDEIQEMLNDDFWDMV